jgi:hypothetical protein
MPEEIETEPVKSSHGKTWDRSALVKALQLMASHEIGKT